MSRVTAAIYRPVGRSDTGRSNIDSTPQPLPRQPCRPSLYCLARMRNSDDVFAAHRLTHVKSRTARLAIVNNERMCDLMPPETAQGKGVDSETFG